MYWNYHNNQHNTEVFHWNQKGKQEYIKQKSLKVCCRIEQKQKNYLFQTSFCCWYFVGANVLISVSITKTSIQDSSATKYRTSTKPSKYRSSVFVLYDNGKASENKILVCTRVFANCSFFSSTNETISICNTGFCGRNTSVYLLFSRVMRFHSTCT